jgi:hypothetical protein
LCLLPEVDVRRYAGKRPRPDLPNILQEIRTAILHHAPTVWGGACSSRAHD